MMPAGWTGKHLACVCTAIACALAFATSAKGEESRSKWLPLDSTTLPRLLADRGFKPPATFKALVVAIEKDAGGALSFRPFDYNGTSDDRDDWWPASTVKIYAAVAALAKLKALGGSPRTALTFHYESGPVTEELRNLVTKALAISHNISFDRLVEFMGSDELNSGFLTPRNGLKNTVLLRSYSGRFRDPVTGRGSNLYSPRIVFSTAAGKEVVLPERHGKGAFACKDQGNCTTLLDLAEAMRRVMLHESLPAAERFALGAKELAVLRRALATIRRPSGAVEGIEAAFGARKVELFHKAGYSYEWFSDNIFVRAPDTAEQWIVAMANRPGREALDEAARHVGALIAEGVLQREIEQ